MSEDAAKSLAQWLKKTLGDKVGEVRVSKRLVDSPAVVVDADKFMTASMRRIMKAMKQDADRTAAGEIRFGNQSGASARDAAGSHAAKGRRDSPPAWRSRFSTTPASPPACWKIRARC